MIEIKEVNIEEVLNVHKNIPEFYDVIPEKEYFENRYKGREKLIIVAYYDGIPAGYIIGYDKFQDNKSFYCWMTGVDVNYRRLGILTQLMDYQTNWAKDKGYHILKIKTRNTRREMLSFLIRNGFYFTDVQTKENIKDNRINLQKDIVNEIPNTQIVTSNNINKLIESTNDIKNILMQLLDFEKEKEEIHLIHRKDMKKLLNCSDITIAKMFNREDFPGIMIGEHKVEKSALKKWLQERRV